MVFERVSNRKYRNSLRIYFLSVPFLGGLFGAIFYFLLVAGVLIAGAQLPNQQIPNAHNLNNQTSPSSQSPTISNPNNSTNPNNQVNHSAISNLTIIAFATLAGFNWEWTVMIFKRIGDSFKGIAEPEHKVEK